MGKLAFILQFILSVFPTDINERRHVHVVLPGKLKKANRGDVVAKIWIEKDGIKCIEVDWSMLSADEEKMILDVIDRKWELINNQMTDIFNGKKVRIIKLK